MAGQGHDNIYSSAGPVSDQTQPQPQMTRDGLTNQQLHSNTQGSDQNANFLNQTGEQVKTMAHGAADIASGAARGAMGIAQGAAVGAANLAQGAATAVKSTLGMNPEQNSSNSSTLPTTNTNTNTTTNTNFPTTRI